MPNWSYNSLKISGSVQEMNLFYKESLKINSNGDLTFRFSNLFPMPSKIKNTISPSSSAFGKKWINEHEISKIRDSKIESVMNGNVVEKVLIPCENNTPDKCEKLRLEFGADNWYDWNIQNYGTKWDVEVNGDSYIKCDDFFESSFDTAWSPPVIFICRLQEKFPNIDIRLTYQVEGGNGCGILCTSRHGDVVEIVEEESEIIYQSEDGREVYFDSESGKFKYTDCDEECDDVISINPFGEKY